MKPKHNIRGGTNMNRKLFSIFIMLIMVFTSVSSSFAEPSQMSEKDFEKHNLHILEKQHMVISIMDELISYKAEMYRNRGSSWVSTEDSYVSELESRLINLGGKKLTQSEIKTFIESHVEHQLNLSLDNILSSVDWWEYQWEDVYHNGKYYTFRQLYAGSSGAGSPLYQTGEVTIWEDRTVTIMDHAGYWVSLYAIKGIGMIPYLQWFPYELITDPINSSTVAGGQYVEVDAHSTMCFSYVTEQDQWGFEYKTHVSNRVNTSQRHKTNIVEAGRSHFTTKTFNDIILSGDNYASIYYPLEVYDSKGPGNFEESFVRSARFYGYDDVSYGTFNFRTYNDPIYLY